MSCVCGLLYGFHPMSLTEMEHAAVVNLDSEMFQKKGWKRASLMWLRIDCWSASRRPWRAKTLLARISTPNFPLSTLTSSQTDTLSLYTWHLLRSEKQGRPWQSWVPFILIGLLRSGIAFGVMDLCVCVCMMAGFHMYNSSVKHNFRNLPRTDSLLRPLEEFI